VCRETAEVLHQERGLEQDLRLRLAARKLNGGHRLLRNAEAELRRRELAIQRQAWRAIACGRTERALAHATLREADAFSVIANLCGESAGPQRYGARHRLLHVGVARQHGGMLALSEPIQR